MEFIYNFIRMFFAADSSMSFQVGSLSGKYWSGCFGKWFILFIT